jgi:two-component system, OmpR family, response regulator RegX3
MSRLLVVDDERDILDTLAFALQREGFEVATAETGPDALERARAATFDVIILDVMLPGLSGLDVCRMLRNESNVLLLTARDAEVDRVLGLELGADDYVTKPFSTAELVSRVRAILRRRELDRTISTSEIAIAGLTINLDTHEVIVDGSAVPLTPSEFRLLRLLAEEPGRVFTREQIMEHLWRTPFVGDARACDTHISNLRRKIEHDPTHPARIETVREVGYRMAR